MQQQDLVQISQEFGSPIYVYDAHTMEYQYTRLAQAFSDVPHLRINYAVKALSNLSVLKWMHQLGAGLDTVSIQEVQLSLHWISMYKGSNLAKTLSKCKQLHPYFRWSLGMVHQVDWNYRS